MTTDKTPAAWFDQAIRNGLASLYVLCLDNAPASDHAGITTEVWVRDLWNSPRREWHMEADLPCIATAFERLRGSCDRWPSPKRFWDLLPDRRPTEFAQLKGRVFTLEERRENLRKLKEMGEELLGIKSEDKAS